MRANDDRHALNPRYPRQRRDGSATLYRVVRHGARATDILRTAFVSSDEARARARYQLLSNKMRQGYIGLVDCMAGVVLKGWAAPRLRTRW